MKPNSQHTRKLLELHSLKSIQLTSTEKEAMKSRLLSYADLHAATGIVPSSIVSPFSRFSFSSAFFYSRTFATLSLVVILLVGSTGVTFAAQNTLPGQPLYVVKVAIAEPIQTALITNPAQKATWQNTLAERRLIEASTLAAQNNLASSTQEYLAAQVTTHVQASEQQSEQLAASGDDSAAVQVRGDLEARLSAHADLLSLIAARLAAAGDATTTAAVQSLLQNVTDQKLALQAGSTTDTPPAKVAFIASLKKALKGDATATTTEVVAIAAPGNGNTISNTTNTAEGVAIHMEEARILKLNAPLLALIPVATTSTSTVATSTATTTSLTNSEESTTADASSTPGQIPFHKGRWLPGLKLPPVESATTSEKL